MTPRLLIRQEAEEDLVGARDWYESFAIMQVRAAGVDETMSSPHLRSTRSQRDL
jgi:hypothetical protein